ncbi:GNAT family N-acetyltransferase [Ferruginibacter albus]|uniref:GNAT family N-acetyltransferase n=1 Tax=Ferruginibacter albus TaxID=2875540 RepID=UPI001CC49E3A|nr:GNAT family N-acetyltransferase [Ferruginibacter albus]UAY52431.1 GNAT family N-acetyltransferase [Ferruginibacter albus]
MNITIRKALKEDCEQIMQLVHELALYEKKPEEVIIDFNDLAKSGFGEKPAWWAFVAEEAGIVIGFALYYIRFSTWKGERMYVEDLLVTEEYRGKGIGKLLFDALIQEAKEKKFSGITWQVLDWNEPAINFYKKLGNVEFDGEWLNGALPL